MERRTINFSINLILIFILFLSEIHCVCKKVTTASGSLASKKFCSGDLIFEENFNKFNKKLWNHEISLYGGYNGEFQWYTNDRANAYTKEGKLFITPTLSYKYLPCKCYKALTSYTLNLSNCTNADHEGCSMTGRPNEIINPIRSARIKTDKSFRFKYGKIRIKAKTPRGPFLWPAIWMMPSNSVYGGWPNSGEIDIMESRGTDQILRGTEELGNRRVMQTLHFGKYHQFTETHNTNEEGFHKQFHLYKVDWKPEYIKFQVDNYPVHIFHGPFQGNYTKSINNIAPFDKQFYFIINLAIGGTNGYMPDDANYAPESKPYANSDGRRVGQTKYWNSKIWKGIENNPDESSLQVDYIKVWAF
uniref:CSON001919 protein n=1 Tax=Culicoides sonorensis TaxID=179676 RepID=A0A336MM97_CULSO